MPSESANGSELLSFLLDFGGSSMKSVVRRLGLSVSLWDDELENDSLKDKDFSFLAGSWTSKSGNDSESDRASEDLWSDGDDFFAGAAGFFGGVELLSSENDSLSTSDFCFCFPDDIFADNIFPEDSFDDIFPEDSFDDILLEEESFDDILLEEESFDDILEDAFVEDIDEKLLEEMPELESEYFVFFFGAGLDCFFFLLDE